jgi:glycosyltransferase involved in cell wall biosynthesis
MKVLLLSDVNSAHTQKWAMGLASSGIKIGIFSLRKPESDWYSKLDIEVFNDNNLSLTYFGKLKYLFSIGKLKRVINDFKPNIVHAHYATSYGLLGAMTGFHPYIISVWGSDVYDFPNRTFIHKAILKFNLKHADKILSTSHSMANETTKFTDKDITVIPFGIDLNVFKRQKVKSLFRDDEIVIGTVKTLEPIYGIDYLIEAFDIIRKRNSATSMKLLIVGGGTLLNDLKELCKKKGIENLVVFTGKVQHEFIPNYHNMIDVYVSLTNYSESFGVAALEASACSKPVVVTDISGFVEVTKDGITGLIVPRQNDMAAADAIEKIILNKDFAKTLGENGRKNVEENYNWEENLKQQIYVYKSLTKDN